MKKMTAALALGFLLMAGVSLLALSVDVSGTWELTSQSPRGERTSEMTIEQDGDKITVTMPGFRGDEMKGEGTVDGNKIEWKFEISTQRGDMTMTYTGTIDGNTIIGQAQMGDFGEMEFSAVKK
ncbi:MAG: hypothetical protein MUP70_00425 [Candidatus Aminicenantes bacterium]|nr:hypothetical protein [Candidatus Aminicenantes bacterium]